MGQLTVVIILPRSPDPLPIAQREPNPAARIEPSVARLSHRRRRTDMKRSLTQAKRARQTEGAVLIFGLISDGARVGLSLCVCVRAPAASFPAMRRAS